MCGGLVMLAPGSSYQILFAVLIMLFHLLIVLKLAPYERESEDWSCIMCTMTLMLTSLGACVMKLRSNSSNIQLIGDILMFLTLLNVVICITITIMFDCNVYDCLRNKNKNKNNTMQVHPIEIKTEEEEDEEEKDRKEDFKWNAAVRLKRTQTTSNTWQEHKLKMQALKIEKEKKEKEKKEKENKYESLDAQRMKRCQKMQEELTALELKIKDMKKQIVALKKEQRMEESKELFTIYKKEQIRKKELKQLLDDYLAELEDNNNEAKETMKDAQIAAKIAAEQKASRLAAEKEKKEAIATAAKEKERLRREAERLAAIVTVCEECNIDFERVNNLKQHHSDGCLKETMTCTVCEAGFQTSTAKQWNDHSCNVAIEEARVEAERLRKEQAMKNARVAARKEAERLEEEEAAKVAAAQKETERLRIQAEQDAAKEAAATITICDECGVDFEKPQHCKRHKEEGCMKQIMTCTSCTSNFKTSSSHKWQNHKCNKRMAAKKRAAERKERELIRKNTKN